MIADRERLKSLGLERFSRYFDDIESQYLCGESILVDRGRNDAENFVCARCREKYNNRSPLIDRRILESRNKMFKYIEDKLYEELEDSLKRGKG